MKLKNLLALVLILFLATNCAKEDEETTDDTTTSENLADTAVTNMASVSTTFAPNSMSRTSSLALQWAKTASDNPCENSESFFDCQPILLRLYIDLAKNMFSGVQSMISAINTGLGGVSGSSTVTMDDGTSVTYNKASSTDIDVIIKNSSGNPYINMYINDNVYQVKFNSANDPDSSSSSSGPGLLDVTLTYTDENTWSFTSLLDGSTCDSSDVRAPEKISIHIAKANGVWTGRAMLYHPRWAYTGNTVDCNTTSTDDIALAMYTDFVANDTAGKAKVYMARGTVSDFATNSDSYELSDICDNFYSSFGVANASSCVTVLTSVFGNPQSYANPFCNLGSSEDASWSDDCTSTDATIGAAAFSTSAWIEPSDFKNQSVSLDTTLPTN